MNNKECIERLKGILSRVLDEEINYKIGDSIEDVDNKAIDHAIAQLEMLDRLEELLNKAREVNDREYDINYDGESMLVGQCEMLGAIRDFLTGDDKALKMLAEVE